MDSCDTTVGCIHTEVDCSDDNRCTLDSCDPTLGCQSTQVSCDDGDACTFDSCDLTTGCTHVSSNCDDNDLCTLDTCDIRRQDPDLGGTGTFQTVPRGALIIPMDNTLQVRISKPYFNLRAYGLAVHLLHANIWLVWSIRSGKGKDEVDLTAAVHRIRPTSSPTVQTLSFKAGPLIIPPQFASQALSVIDSFNQGQTDKVIVYETVDNVTVEVKHQLLHKPFVAILNSGSNYPIQAAYATAAGLVQGVHWQITSKEQASSLNNTSCYTLATEPHFDSSSAPDPPAKFPTAMRNFLNSGGNFLAECHGKER